MDAATEQTFSTMIDQFEAPEEQTVPPPAQQQPQQQQQQPQQQYCAAPPSQHPPTVATQPAAQEKGWASTLIRLFTNPAILKALACAFVVVFVIITFPVEDPLFKHIPALAKIPNSASVLKAVLAAIAVTALRPPSHI